MAVIEVDGMRVFSVGVEAVDVELSVGDRSDIEDGVSLVRAVSDYVQSSGRSLAAGETFGYGYWLIRFDASDTGRLSISEHVPDASGFTAGASLAMRYWREQHEICERFGSSFVPPRADQMVAISAGVYEGDAVQGVRYPAPGVMSGWYLTTPRFNGDASTLVVEHLYHLTTRRPDLAPYVALAPGHRFDTTSGGDDVWLDPAVASEAP